MPGLAISPKMLDDSTLARGFGFYSFRMSVRTIQLPLLDHLVKNASHHTRPSGLFLAHGAQEGRIAMDPFLVTKQTHSLQRAAIAHWLQYPLRYAHAFPQVYFYAPSCQNPGAALIRGCHLGMLRPGSRRKRHRKRDYLHNRALPYPKSRTFPSASRPMHATPGVAETRMVKSQPESSPNADCQSAARNCFRKGNLPLQRSNRHTTTTERRRVAVVMRGPLSPLG